MPGNTIDVVISNCVINLSVDKPAVFAEAFRVLRPGGRLGISDVVADDHLTAAERAERGSYVSCVSGALTFTEYREGLEAAGFASVEITPAFGAADGMHSAIVRAVKPLDIETVTAGVPAQEAGSCCGVSACCTAGEQSVDPDVTIAEAKTAAGRGCQ